MKPPKIDICIEGYDTNQTDFYISNLIEQHDADAKRVTELQKENERLRSELEIMSSSMKEVARSFEKVNLRLSAIEKNLGISHKEMREEAVSKAAEEAFAAEQAEIGKKLDAIRANIGSLRTILNK